MKVIIEAPKSHLSAFRALGGNCAELVFHPTKLRTEREFESLDQAEKFIKEQIKKNLDTGEITEAEYHDLIDEFDLVECVFLNGAEAWICTTENV